MKPQVALVILDAPSAALDPEAEEIFFERLLREVQGKSVIFISHRFSTVRCADKLFSLRHGHIDEQGTHEELMQHNGRYAALFRMQARWYERTGAVIVRLDDWWRKLCYLGRPCSCQSG